MNNYQDFINEFVKKFVANFSDYFDQNIVCEQNIELTNSTNLNLQNATIKNCTFNINQSNLTNGGEKLCSNISDRLLNMSKDELRIIINPVVENTSKNYNLSPDFKSLITEKLVEFLSSSTTKDRAKCFQNIVVQKDQVIFITGELICQNGSQITINNKTIVNAFLNCLVNPILVILKNDPDLQNSYNPRVTNCVWDKIKDSDCQGGTRNYRVKILKEASNGGVCLDDNGLPIQDNKIITESCNIPSCGVSDWTEWSPCIGGTHSRLRTITSPGVNCPPTIQTENCEISPPTRKIIKPTNFLITGKIPIPYLILTFIPFLVLLYLIYKK